jgi:predicted  nucleic acid-binding Zn-ribbon protein
MLELIADNTLFLIIVAVLAAAILVLVAIVWTWQYETRQARMPLATRSAVLDFEVARKQSELDSLDEKLQEMQQMITEHGRYSGEVAALKEQLENLRCEYASLNGQREEIEEVKKQAAEVAEAYARAEEQRLELENLAHRHQQLTDRCTKLEHRNSELETEYQEKRTGLEASLSDLKHEEAELTDRIDQLRTELRDLKAQRAELAEIESQLEELAARKRTMEQAIATMDADYEKARGAADRLAELQEQEKEVRSRLDEMSQSASRLEAQIAQRESELGRLASEIGGSPGAPEPDVDALLADLRREPQCLSAPSGLAKAAMSEEEALGNLNKRLEERGLTYPRRIQRAFHTALKINDHAQMTVLAGVSGTGKSLLPRSYAEALGIHFLPIAVEPRWDSPQDLLGFYNYVEKQYRATDLARALARLDPYDTAKIGADYKDRMLMVLLDEMNLARVEYYFSEFLSRLEARPKYGEEREKASRRFSEIQIDIRGLADEQMPAIFPGHNVLFTGTMNDDESTQALSEKVMDRGNIMQFPAPGKFVLPGKSNDSDTHISNEALAFATWRTWVKEVDNLQGSDFDKAKEIVEKLSVIMKECGRPFGHRLYAAMLAYIANYPKESEQRAANVNVPLTDQIETRILPKLRGVEIEEKRQYLERLVTLVREELHDEGFADAIEATMEVDSGRGLFNWRGFVRAV